MLIALDTTPVARILDPKPEHALVLLRLVALAVVTAVVTLAALNLPQHQPVAPNGATPPLVDVSTIQVLNQPAGKLRVIPCATKGAKVPGLTCYVAR